MKQVMIQKLMRDEFDAKVKAVVDDVPACVARLKQATATSAGGIVIRFVGDSAQLVVGKRQRTRDEVTWTLPKGTPQSGETREQTALREAREEVGVDPASLTLLGALATMLAPQGYVLAHRSLGRFREYLERFPWVPFIGDGRALKRPVWTDDLVSGLVALLQNPERSGWPKAFFGAL